jgi:nucleoside-triphosphatase THEP1
VALLTFADDLPAALGRIVVAGTSGSGKTTMAGKIAMVLSIPHIEIDGLMPLAEIPQGCSSIFPTLAGSG